MGICQKCRRNTIVSKKYVGIFQSPLCRRCNFAGAWEIERLAAGLKAVAERHL